MVTLTENSINGWYLGNIKKDSVPYGIPLIHADVYYKGKKVGEYLESQFFGDLITGELVDVILHDSDAYAADDLLERYLADGKLLHSYLEDQFEEVIYNKETIAKFLLSIYGANYKRVNQPKEHGLDKEFVLNYSRKDVLVCGERFITYKVTSCDLVTKGDFDNYVKQAKVLGDYPILLPSKYTCQ